MSAIVVRAQPAVAKDYGEYREQLRFDFWYACAYCSCTEFESRGHSFAIDHYQPQLHGGGDEYVNLYWACTPCNGRKSAYWPEPDGFAAGYLVVRVDQDDPRDHLSKDPKDPDRVVALTNKGTTTISVLDLNSRRLRRIRELRRRLVASDELVIHGVRAIGRARIDQLPSELKMLTERLRRELKDRADDVPEELAALVREFGKSELLDPDPDAKEHAEVRRQFLRDTGALPMRKPRKP